MKTLFIPLVAAAILGSSGSASAQRTASTTGKANARLICQIGIVNERNLHFGTVVSGNGTAHVTHAGTESYTGNIQPGSQGGTHTSAQFRVSGETGFHFAHSRMPASGILTITDGSGHTALVQLDPPVAQSGTLGTLAAGGGPSGGSGHDGNDDEDDDDHGSDEHHEGGDDCNDDNDHHESNNNDCGCDGTQTYNVGGVLYVTAGLPSGTYKNTNSGGTLWTETVTYN